MKSIPININLKIRKNIRALMLQGKLTSGQPSRFECTLMLHCCSAVDLLGLASQICNLYPSGEDFSKTYSNYNIRCTNTRTDKFIGTARMVSIYGRKYDIIFKHAEINSSEQNFCRVPQPHETSDRFLR